MKRRSALLLMAALLISALAARAQQQAHRIVSIIPATTEMLFAMGGGDRVVAIGTYDRYPPEATKLPRVGALYDPDVERILSLKPDLVVVYETQADLRAQLDRAQIPYFLYRHRGLADIAGTIRSLGARVGLADRANELAASLEQRIAAIRTKVANRPRPKTLLVFGREAGSLRGLDASGGVGFLHDMLEAAGGADAVGDVKQQSVMMSTEMLLARAPEVIIELRYSRETRARDDMRAWDSLPALPAVRAHRVYLLQGEEFVVPGPRMADATERLARTLHPDAWRQ